MPHITEHSRVKKYEYPLALQKLGFAVRVDLHTVEQKAALLGTTTILREVQWSREQNKRGLIRQLAY